MRKSLLITAIFILIVNFVSAQNTRLGFTAGPVASTMFQKVSGKKHMYDFGYAFTAGALLDVPMQKHGSFQPGINYIMKNSKDTYTDPTTNKQVLAKYSLTYIEVPINVVFRIPAGSSGNVLLGGGVAPAMAIKGKTTNEIDNTITKDQGLNFGDETKDDFGQYDFGINAIAGYEFNNGFFIQLNYNHGINRLFVGGDPEDKLYNRYFALRLGYLISCKKKK
ncbi:MAG: PorT family protein [Bacteroidetes bacterium]|jgi:hypothetical protein|nr:MAG: PorT family protein [Bacteroidota bacterium]